MRHFVTAHQQRKKFMPNLMDLSRIREDSSPICKENMISNKRKAERRNEKQKNQIIIKRQNLISPTCKEASITPSPIGTPTNIHLLTSASAATHTLLDIVEVVVIIEVVADSTEEVASTTEVVVEDFPGEDSIIIEVVETSLVHKNRLLMILTILNTTEVDTVRVIRNPLTTTLLKKSTCTIRMTFHQCRNPNVIEIGSVIEPIAIINAEEITLGITGNGDMRPKKHCFRTPLL